MAQTQSVSKVELHQLSPEFADLPIFKVAGASEFANKIATPQAKTFFSKILFWGLLIGAGYALFIALPSLIAFAKAAVWLTIYAVLAIVLIGNFSRITGFLSMMVKTFLKKMHSAFIRENYLDTLEVLMDKARDQLGVAQKKITEVLSVRDQMKNDGIKEAEAAEQKERMVMVMQEQLEKMEAKAQQLAQQGSQEQADQLRRDLKARTQQAIITMQEAKSAKSLGLQYAQYANQFSKALEILKDHKLGAEMYVSALGSSITILKKKAEATAKMRRASSNLADVFQVGEDWMYKEAMNAATTAISDNIAHIKTNLETLNLSNNFGSNYELSAKELSSFVGDIDSGKIKPINVHKLSDANYDLKRDEKPDSTFDLFG